MKSARYAWLMAVILLSACDSKENEVTAPASTSSPAAEAAGWSRARTWTPTKTITPALRTATPTRTPTRTPTSTPTPPINLNGRWVGTFTYDSCIARGLQVTIDQSGNSISGYFGISCVAGPPDGSLEFDGTLQGNTLVVSLWDGDILLGTLTGPASSMTITVWDPGHMIGLSLTR